MSRGPFSDPDATSWRSRRPVLAGAGTRQPADRG